MRGAHRGRRPAADEHGWYAGRSDGAGMPCQIADPAAGGMIWLPSIDLDRRAGDDVGPAGFELGGRLGRDLDRGALEGQGRFGVHVNGAGTA